MKYLIISRPGETTAREVTRETLQQGKRMLRDGLERGVIEGAYTLAGGGNVLIVNADSHETLARGLRKLRAVVGAPHVEVHPILDTADVFEAYEKQFRENNS